jgi:DNA-binding transcriptional LysR family regulator
MKPIHLDRFDLNLLVVLNRVYVEGSVTRAAASLNLTQSAISHALRRLRDSLSDRLFERHGTALAPTPLMKNLAQPLNETLRSLEQVVNSGNHFEPLAAARCFVIGMDERLALFALPSFIERMVKIAPNLDLASAPFDPREVAALLANGDMDVVVGAETFDNPSLKRMKVAQDHLVVAARRGHPLVSRRRISLRNYQAAEHIAVSGPSRQPTEDDLVLSRSGLTRRVRIRVRRYVAAMDIVAKTDMLLTLPLKYAHVINAGYGHDLLPLPIKMAPMEFFLHWHTSTTRDAGVRWLRDELARSFQSDPAGIGSASLQAAQKVVAGQIGRGSAAKPSTTKNVAPARPHRHCQTAPSGMKTRLPAPASKPR